MTSSEVMALANRVMSQPLDRALALVAEAVNVVLAASRFQVHDPSENASRVDLDKALAAYRKRESEILG